MWSELPERDFSVRMRCAKRPDIRHQSPAENCIAGKAYAQTAHVPAQGSLYYPLGVRRLIKGALSFGAQQLTRVGEFDSTAGTHEQSAAEFFLKRLYLHAQR